MQNLQNRLLDAANKSYGTKKITNKHVKRPEWWTKKMLCEREKITWKRYLKQKD